MSTYKFWGKDCRTSRDYVTGAPGVIVGGKRIAAHIFENGRRAAEAGSDGVREDALSRTDREILAGAGAIIRTENLGTRVVVDHLPEPTGYVVEVKTPEPVRYGQYGAPLTPNA